jgi:hypothetical protein
MKATLDQPICMATDLGLTPSSRRMQVQVWRVAACQFVFGKPAFLRRGL